MTCDRNTARGVAIFDLVRDFTAPIAHGFPVVNLQSVQLFNSSLSSENAGYFNKTQRPSFWNRIKRLILCKEIEGTILRLLYSSSLSSLRMFKTVFKTLLEVPYLVLHLTWSLTNLDVPWVSCQQTQVGSVFPVVLQATDRSRPLHYQHGTCIYLIGIAKVFQAFMPLLSVPVHCVPYRLHTYPSSPHFCAGLSLSRVNTTHPPDHIHLRSQMKICTHDGLDV